MDEHNKTLLLTNLSELTPIPSQVKVKAVDQTRINRLNRLDIKKPAKPVTQKVAG